MEYLELLQPPTPTPTDEICQCQGAKPVKLMCALGYNPIHCIDCNLEVDPADLALTECVVRGIAFWRSMHDAIDRLWLASGEYEEWAQCQLSDINSPINRLGRKARADLDPIRRCYYWFFQDQSADDFEPDTHCPVCGAAFVPYDGGIFPQYLCEACSIIIVGG